MLWWYLWSFWLCLGMDILCCKALADGIAEDYTFLKKHRNDYEKLLSKLDAIIRLLFIACIPVLNLIITIFRMTHYEDMKTKLIQKFLEEKRIVKKEK